MNTARRVVVLLCLLAALSIQVQAEEIVSAQAEIFGVDELQKALPSEAEALLSETEVTEDQNFWEGVMALLQNAAGAAVEIFFGGIGQALRLLLIIVICHLVDAVCEERGKAAALIAGVLTLASICMADLNTLIGLGRSTMEALSDFTAVLNPVMAAASTASGSVAGAGMNYALTVFFSNVLVKLCSQLLIPAVYAYLALAVTDSVQQQERLKKLRELLGWGIELCLKAVVYAFTGCLAVTGILSGTTDAAKLKAAKLAISSMIPVVGGIISNATETVLSGAELLKGTIGTIGMLAILAIFLLPFLRMGISYLLLKIVTALSGIFVSRLSGLLEAVAKAMGYLLAMTGSSALICVLTCCCYLKVVQT